MKKDTKKAQEIWDLLTNVPVNDDEEIDEDFLYWERGTVIYDIWQDIEDRYCVSIVKDLRRTV